MPNHVTNRLKIQADGDKIKEILSALQDDEAGIGSLDFNKIILMPEALNIIDGSQTEKGLKMFHGFLLASKTHSDAGLEHQEAMEKHLAKYQKMRENDPETWELGKKAYNNIVNYGHQSWYNWSIANWGTKWNSYGYKNFPKYNGGDEIRFLTAWSAPHPILKKLSEMFPDVTVKHKWADEDIGANCGERTYFGGEIVDEYYPDYGVSSYDFAAEVLEEDLAERGLFLNQSGDKYVYVDDEEYELIELLDKPMLFSNSRIFESDLPQGLYCYNFRESDSGGFAALEPKVAVNHGGTVITNEPIDFGKVGYIALDEDSVPNFTGDTLTIGAYLRGELEQDGGMKLG